MTRAAADRRLPTTGLSGFLGAGQSFPDIARLDAMVAVADAGDPLDDDAGGADLQARRLGRAARSLGGPGPGRGGVRPA